MGKGRGTFPPKYVVANGGGWENEVALGGSSGPTFPPPDVAPDLFFIPAMRAAGDPFGACPPADPRSFSMTRFHKALAVMVVTALGLWGCAQGNNGQAERLRALENKCNKLEEDYKAVAGARDTLRKKLQTVEEEQARLQQEADAHKPLLEERQNLLKEKEELTQQINTRTAERDAMQGQMEQVRKGLKNLLGQADAALKPAGAPALSAAPTGASHS